MSLMLELSSDDWGSQSVPLASAEGWRLVGQWCSVLPKKFKLLRRLSDKGTCDDTEALNNELDEAIRTLRPGIADVGDTLKQLQESLAGGSPAETARVTDGSEDDDNDDEAATSPSTPSPTGNTRWRFHSDPAKMSAFMDWLKQQYRDLFDNPTEEQMWAQYIFDGYLKGAGRSFDDLTAAERAGFHELDEVMTFFGGGKDFFLRTMLSAPVQKERVQVLAQRSLTDLKGVTDGMATRMQRVLADGLVQGQNPNTIAKTLANEVDVGRSRAVLISRTEIMRAHAEGQLSAMERLGVTEIGVMVEWEVTEDNKLCKACEAMRGVVLKLSEARGMLPRHPACRCVFLPSNVGEPRKGQVRGQMMIDRAIKKSVGEQGTWGGSDRKISKIRPKSRIRAKGKMR